ncbi:unnamed protein product [Microthlaspi erraticum]|uniref:WW domain-containing protein n=1 Tax=Microthlaspi erraticum TaxID=1685480 RepID=A0A6D2IET3_9BRAS|nr:unnamed protein product [Microthlaspi erraticum]
MGKVGGEEEEEGAAIKALGSLFKLTEIHLWDDGSTDSRLAPLFHKHKNRSEDMGLLKEMKDLGLPASFRTNKEWKNRTRGHQKKGIKDLSSEVNVLSKEEDMNLVYDCSSDHAIGGDEEIEMPNDCVERNAVEEESCCLGDGDGDSVLVPEATDSQSYRLGDDNDDSGEWKVYWDAFYGRSYFYNVNTQESTWEAPLGMEHLAYSYECNQNHNLDELAIETTEKPHDDLLRDGLTDDVGGLIESQCETEALEEVNSLIDTYQETSNGNQSLDITTLEEEGNGTYVVNSNRKAKKKTRRICFPWNK